MKPHLSLTPLRVFLLASTLAVAPQASAQQAVDPPLVEIAEVAPVADGDVLDVAAAAGQFETFLQAVQAAGYEETLRGEGPFTIFAPTDEAFAQMDPAELERLMQPQQRDELLALLAYHVVPERVTRDGVHGIVSAEAASGFRVQLDGRDGLRINDHLVVAPDIEASNGVIQGVNAVLAPPTLVAQN